MSLALFSRQKESENWRIKDEFRLRLFVINPNNLDTTDRQLRDCIYDAIEELAERIVKLNGRLNKLERKHEKAN